MTRKDKKQRVNVAVNKKGKRRIGIFDHTSDTIKVAGKKPYKRGVFARLGAIIGFEKW